MKNNIIAYASAFCSYLLENVDDIRTVILYGSASRGEAKGESDIDIFIDTIYSKNEQKIKKIVESFYNTQIFRSWSLKGIKNPISVVTGNIEGKKWRDLKRSIITDGIILFGKYTSKPEGLRHYMLFSYHDIKNANKRVNLHRRLFGYRIGDRHYEGVVFKSNGIRHGRGSFSVPMEHYKDVISIFREMKITPEITEVWIG